MSVGRRLAGVLLLAASTGCVGWQPLHRSLKPLPSCSDAVMVSADQLNNLTSGSALWVIPIEALKGTPEYEIYRSEGVAGILANISLYSQSRRLSATEPVSLTGRLYLAEEAPLAPVFGTQGDLYLFEAIIDDRRVLLPKSILGLPEAPTCDLALLPGRAADKGKQNDSF